MSDKDPTTYSLLTYFWVFGLSAWGGFVSYMRKLRQGATRKFSFVEMLTELVTSAFVGVLTFWLCDAANIDQLLTAALVGISGHMGSRAILMIESWAKKKLPF